MRAFVLDPSQCGSASLRLQKGRATPALGPRDVLVRVRAVSLNHRDLAIADGCPGYRAEHAVVPLSDSSGEVIELGKEVRGLKLGQRVVNTFFPDWTSQNATRENTRRTFGADSDGVASEFAVFNESALLPLPDTLSFEEAAALPCAGVTAWHALMEHGTVRPGEYVAVLGTGGVASMALQLAVAAGARVAVISGDDDKLCRAVHMGASYTINHHRMPQWQDGLMAWTDGRGVDQMVDVCGDTLPRSVAATRVGGKVSVVGDLASQGTLLDPRQVLERQVRLQGVNVGSRSMFQALLAALSVNRIKPVISDLFGFDETPAAYDALRRGRHVGKLVVAL